MQNHIQAQWVCSRERRIALYKRSSINQSIWPLSCVDCVECELLYMAWVVCWLCGVWVGVCGRCVLTVWSVSCCTWPLLCVDCVECELLYMVGVVCWLCGVWVAVHGQSCVLPTATEQGADQRAGHSVYWGSRRHLGLCSLLLLPTPHLLACEWTPIAHTHTYTHTHIHTHTPHTHTHSYIHPCMHTHMHAHTYAFTHTHTLTHSHTHACTYTHSYTHSCMHTHNMHSYTHTHNIHTHTHNINTHIQIPSPLHSAVLYNPYMQHWHLLASQLC